MSRLLLPLGIALCACTADPTPLKEQPSPVVLLAAPESESKASASAATKSSDESTIPPSIPLGATTTSYGPDGSPGVTVSSGEANAVTWDSTEVKLTPLPFDASKVTAKPISSDLWEHGPDDQRTIRVCYTISGLPTDALFLELDPKASEVVWSNETKGTIRAIHSQWSDNGAGSMDVLTTVPPGDAGIRSVRVALDVHQPTRTKCFKANVEVGTAARFSFGVRRMEWVLSSDLHVTEFGAGQYKEPLTPLFNRGLYPAELVTLVDAKGVPLRHWGGGGAGSQTIYQMAVDSKEPLVPPVKVTVDLPLDTLTTRVVVSLRDIPTVR